MRFVSDFGNVVIWALGFVIVSLVVTYTAMTKWRSWTTGVGAGMQAAWICVLVIIIPSLLALAGVITPQFAGTVWYLWVGVFTVTYALVFAVIHLVSIIRLQLKGENKHVTLKEEKK